MKRIVFSMILGLGALLLVRCSEIAVKQKEIKRLELSAKGINRVEIYAGAGDLDISPSYSANVVLKAEIGVNIADEAKAKEYIKKSSTVSLEKRGANRLVVEATFDSGMFPLNWGKGGVVDLVLWVPMNKEIYIVNQGGNINISGLRNSLRVEDGNGSLVVENHRGELLIADKGGEINLANIVGKISITDGRGAILIKQVTGAATVLDGGGLVTIQGLKGNVDIKDGSGDIVLESITGNVRISESGGGKVKAKGVAGSFTLND